MGITRQERHVGLDQVGKYWISTTRMPWAGLGYVYETMVFEEKDGVVDFTDLYCKRYDSREAAEAGHAEAVALVKKGEAPFDGVDHA